MGFMAEAKGLIISDEVSSLLPWSTLSSETVELFGSFVRSFFTLVLFSTFTEVSFTMQFALLLFDNKGSAFLSLVLELLFVALSVLLFLVLNDVLIVSIHRDKEVTKINDKIQVYMCFKKRPTVEGTSFLHRCRLLLLLSTFCSVTFGDEKFSFPPCDAEINFESVNVGIEEEKVFKVSSFGGVLLGGGGSLLSLSFLDKMS
mmetsp:Transcript_29480/g.54127  ORF Transcript_29480/g.54127 Transcript_29480/m.54127 type:complete len:202 (-) Transcript_29480:346-951(-)